MSQVEGLKSTAENQFGTLDPNELVALAKQKVNTDAIMAKLQDPTSITMADISNVQA